MFSSPRPGWTAVMIQSGQFPSSAKVSSSHSNTRSPTLKLGVLLVYFSFALVEDVQERTHQLASLT